MTNRSAAPRASASERAVEPDAEGRIELAFELPMPSVALIELIPIGLEADRFA